MTLDLYPDLEQRSPEWHEARRGIVTASVVGSLISQRTLTAIDYACPACGRGIHMPCGSKREPRQDIKTLHQERVLVALKEAAPPLLEPADNDTARGLVTSLVAERVSGFHEDTPMSSDMWRGVEHEPFAREAYNEHNAEAAEYGLMVRREKGWTLGLSPDGVIGDEGLLEIKCPRAKTHVATILADEVPAHYVPQCQAALLVSGRKWLDFCSYVGGLPLYVKRVYPDPAWQSVIAAAAHRFEQTAAEMVARYETATKNMPATERPTYLMEIV